MNDDQTLSLTEAAARLDVDTRELLDMIDRGEITAVKIDGLLRVRGADLGPAATPSTSP